MLMTCHSRYRTLPLMILSLLVATCLLGACSKQETQHQEPEPEWKPDPSLPPLAIEETGQVETLPDAYPESWMFVDEANFFNMFGGKVILLDVTESNAPDRIKGMVDKNLLGNFVQARKRREFYVLETFHERGARGARTDVLVIYDKKTLSPIKEFVWPRDRLTALPERYAMSLSADERFLYAANLNPATSFGVVDLQRREIASVVETPGCVLVYPTGKRSITSICNNGGLLTTTLDENGNKLSQTRMAPFFDTDKTPVFERPAIVDNLAYFPSFDGIMHVIDLRTEQALYVGSWSLLTDKERAAKWAPSGLGLIDRDEQGNVYLIMQPDAHEGSHNQGGPEVWVYDVRERRRIQVIETPNWAISIAVSRGARPLLVVTSGELNLDVYDVRSGELLQTVGDFGNVTPLLVHKAH